MRSGLDVMRLFRVDRHHRRRADPLAQMASVFALELERGSPMLERSDDLGSLLDRLRGIRARRDDEPRHSQRWFEVDAELHDVERRIFRVPLNHLDEDDERQTAV